LSWCQRTGKRQKPGEPADESYPQRHDQLEEQSQQHEQQDTGEVEMQETDQTTHSNTEDETV